MIPFLDATACAALFLAVLTLWVSPRIAIATVALAVTLGYVAGILHGPAALWLLAIALPAARLGASDGWPRVGWIAITGVLGVALGLHVLPGFSNPLVLEDVMLASGARPYSQYINFDKTLAGVLFLACSGWMPIRARDWTAALPRALPVILLTAAATIAASIALGLVRLDVRWPSAWRTRPADGDTSSSRLSPARDMRPSIIVPAGSSCQRWRTSPSTRYISCCSRIPRWPDKLGFQEPGAALGRVYLRPRNRLSRQGVTMGSPRLVPLMLTAVTSALCIAAAQESARFSMAAIDGGAAESAAVADFNNDGKLDIVSAESWYEAPGWTKRPIRTIPVSSGYVDSFSDLPLDVNGDGFTDLIQIGYFARRIVWMKNPGPGGGGWTENLIDAVGPTEFAFLVDLDNDGASDDLLPQFTGAASAPLTWYELQKGEWVKHVVGTRSHGHGIGAGDVNGDKRNDILTPQGWLEAPANPRAAGEWTFHATDWQQQAIPAPAVDATPSLTTPPAMAAPPPATAPPAGGRAAEWGFLYVLDINGDGRNDVLTTSAHSYGVCWFEQRADGSWQQHVIDHSWSHAHASVLADVDGNGRPDLVTGKRYQSRNQPAPGDNDPLGLYWYEFTRGSDGKVTWKRHTIDYGSKAGSGLQMAVRDIDGDGDMDVVSGGKSGLFLAVNLTKGATRGGKQMP